MLNVESPQAKEKFFDVSERRRYLVLKNPSSNCPAYPGTSSAMGRSGSLVYHQYSILAQFLA
jgi:hypothetical protein